MGQPHQRIDIDGDELVFPLRIDLGHSTVCSESRVVHQHADLAATERRDQLVDAIPRCEIPDDHFDVNSRRVLLQPPPDLVQPGRVAPGKQQRHAPFRQPFSEDRPQPELAPVTTAQPPADSLDISVLP